MPIFHLNGGCLRQGGKLKPVRLLNFLCQITNFQRYTFGFEMDYAVVFLFCPFFAGVFWVTNTLLMHSYCLVMRYLCNPDGRSLVGVSAPKAPAIFFISFCLDVNSSKGFCHGEYVCPADHRCYPKYDKFLWQAETECR
jgi:hypothetical protein